MDPNSTDFLNYWMLSPMFRSSKYLCGLLEKVPRAPIIIGVILTLRNPQSLFFSKDQVNIFLLFLVLLQAYPVIIRESDVNNVAFVCFLVDHENVWPVMRYFPICLDGKIPKNFNLVIL